MRDKSAERMPVPYDGGFGASDGLLYIECVMHTRTAEIIPAEFPELSLLAWNRDVTRPMPAKEVFALYERNWRFVDQTRLTAPERQLIAELAEEFGGGFLLTPR